MVTQKEAVEGYIKLSSNLENLGMLIDYRFNEINKCLSEMSLMITKNEVERDKFVKECDEHRVKFNTRVTKLERFESKVIYFYTAISMIVGIIIGWKLL